MFSFFFFNDTATTEIYTLSLHDALPILLARKVAPQGEALKRLRLGTALLAVGVIVVNLFGRHIGGRIDLTPGNSRSEEHTSELQSLAYLVCRLLLEKKKKNKRHCTSNST